MKVKLNEEIKEYCNILKLKGVKAHFEELMSEAADYEDMRWKKKISVPLNAVFEMHICHTGNILKTLKLIVSR